MNNKFYENFFLIDGLGWVWLFAYWLQCGLSLLQANVNMPKTYDVKLEIDKITTFVLRKNKILAMYKT